MQIQRRAWQTGLTLTETLVTMAVAAILISTAIPSVEATMAAWQRDAATRDFLSALRLARTEALKTRHRVVVCNSRNGTDCSEATHKEWRDGWIVFADVNSNNQRETTESIFAVNSGQSAPVGMMANNRIKRFAFNATGLMVAGMCTFEISHGNAPVRKITINRTGRPRLSLKPNEG